MFLFQLLTTIFCGVICFYSARNIRRNFPCFSLFGILGVIHGLVPALTPAALQTAYFSSDSRYEASVFAFISIVLLACGWFFAESLMRKQRVTTNEILAIIQSPKGQRLYRRLFWSTMAIGTLGWVIYYWGAGASLAGLMRASRFEYRDSGSTALKLLGIHLVSLTFMPGFLGLMLPKRYTIIGTTYTLILAVFSFVILAAGTRSIALGMVGSIGVAYIMRRQVSPVRFLMITGLTGVLFLLAISLYEVRKTMSYTSLSSVTTTMLTPATYQSALVTDPLNYHENLVGALDSFPRKHNYLNGATYQRILFFWAPSSLIAGLKPEDANQTFAIVVYNTDPELAVTVPPTMPGDAYINFWGWVGLGFLFFEGMVLAWVGRILQTNFLCFTAFGPQFVRYAMLLPRGQPYDIFVMLLVVLILTTILMRLNGYSVRSAQRDLKRLLKRQHTSRTAQSRTARGKTRRLNGPSQVPISPMP